MKMPPFNNSFPPQPPNQPLPSTSTSLNPQVFSANPSAFQPQLGIMNPQFPVPFPFNNSPNPHLSNGQSALNLLNMLAQQQQPGLMSSSINFLGMNPLMGLGFSPQSFVNNVGLANQANPFPGQGQGGVFVPNIPGLAQSQFNPSMAFPNLPNQMQNLSSVLPPLPMDPSRVGPFGVQSNCTQPLDPQALNLLQNVLFATGQQVNQNQQRNGMAAVGTNVPVSLPILNQQEQVNSSAVQQSQNSQSPTFVGKLNMFGKEGHGGVKNSNWKPFSRSNPKREWKKEGSQLGHQRPHFQHRDNRKRKFGFSDERKGKGQEHGRAAGFGSSSLMNQAMESRRSSLVLSYTEQEIKRWREDRKKNFPSKANIEKKNKNLIQPEALQSEAKLRREQLKEILAKQAELGVEVADIPPEYLCDSEKQVNVNGRNRSGPNEKWRNSRFHNKRDKRGPRKFDSSAYRQQSGNKGSSNVAASSKQKPTLLQKLLSADIRRDKQRLLQVFRFMVTNSFFKDWPETPLKYPLVKIGEDDLEEEKSSPCEVSAVSPKKMSENSLHGDKNQEDGRYVDHCNESDDEDDEDHNDNTGDGDDNYAGVDVERGSISGKGKGNCMDAVINVEDAEEGEIID